MRGRLLVAFGVGLCVASAVVGWAYGDTSVEGAYFSRSTGAPPYAGVFSWWTEAPDPWSAAWFSLVVGRWLLLVLALLVGVLVLRQRVSTRASGTLAGACVVLACLGLLAVLTTYGGPRAGVGLALVGSGVTVVGTLMLRGQNDTSRL